MKKIYIILVILLTGCASTFTHPTKDSRGKSRDKMKCRVIASQARPQDIFQKMSYFNECMHGEGWDRK